MALYKCVCVCVREGANERERQRCFLVVWLRVNVVSGTLIQSESVVTGGWESQQSSRPPNCHSACALLCAIPVQFSSTEIIWRNIHNSVKPYSKTIVIIISLLSRFCFHSATKAQLGILKGEKGCVHFPAIRPHTSTICKCSVFPALAGYMARGSRSNSVQGNPALVTQSVAPGCFLCNPGSGCWWILPDGSGQSEIIMKSLLFSLLFLIFIFVFVGDKTVVDGDVCKNHNGCL